LFGPVETHDIVPVARAAQRTVPLVPAWLLYPLGCMGLVLLALERGRRLPALCALAAALPYLVFSVTPRYRLVLAPLCCIGLGVLVAAAIDLARSRERAALGRLGIAALVSLVFVIPPATLRALARAADKGMASSVLAERGASARRRGDLVEAGRQLADAIGEQPLGFEVLDLRGLPWEERSFWTRVQTRYQRELAQSPSPALEYEAGLVDEWAGAHDSALAHYERAAAGGYYLRGADPEYSAGRLLLELHREGEATKHIDRSLDHHPGVLASLVAAEVLARHRGDGARADALAREAEARHDRISTGWARARAWRWLGDARMALGEIEHIPEPENALVRWEECLDLVATGDEAGALRAYERALALLPMHPFTASRLDSVVARQLERAPGDPRLLRLAGEHALRRGRMAEAIEHYRAAMAADPQLGNDPELTSHLALAELAQRRGSPPGFFVH
jgi:tetratricopeptide (TPR) repeat protein